MAMVNTIRARRWVEVHIGFLKIVYTRIVVEFPLVYGKLVKFQHSPATVSAEVRSNKSLFRRRNGKAGRVEDAQVRRPAGGFYTFGSRGRSLECEEESQTFRPFACFFPPAFPPLKLKVRLSIHPERPLPAHRSRLSAAWEWRRKRRPQPAAVSN